jgi:hypothetical protein
MPKVAFDQSSAAVKATWSAEGAAQGFTLSAEATSAALAEVVGIVKSLASSATDFAAIQDEELQMLWWLFGGRSTDMDRAFDAIDANAQPLVLAAELAGMTKFLPGPVSTKAILSRAGVKEGECTVPATVNACDAQWLARLVEGREPSPITQPIHFAVKRKLETGDDNSWVAGWSGVVGIDAGHALPALTLANLFYRERLLAQFAED